MVREPADEWEAEILRRAMAPGGFEDTIIWEGYEWTYADLAHGLGLLGDD